MGAYAGAIWAAGDPPPGGGGPGDTALFQSVREKKPGESPSPLGVGPEGLYLYLGSAGEDLEDVKEFLWEGQAFEVLRRRAVHVGGQVLYQWALCRELDEVEP